MSKKKRANSATKNDNNKATLDSIINDTLKNIKSIIDMDVPNATKLGNDFFIFSFINLSPVHFICLL